MSDKTGIEWTDATWNPVTGCTKVSPGCAYCYIDRTPAFRIKGRKFVAGSTGVILHPERLDQPLRWKRPRMIFVNSLSDVFHEDVPRAYLDKMFAVMALSPQHTFQVLTKRPERMLDYFLTGKPWQRVSYRAFDFHRYSTTAAELHRGIGWPLPNVWLGVTIENARHTYRADMLRQAPAAVRFVSAEPLIGSLYEHGHSHTLGEPGSDARSPADASGRARRGSRAEGGWAAEERGAAPAGVGARASLDLTGVDWIIVGGESGGKHVRPMSPRWAREIRDACLHGLLQPKVQRGREVIDRPAFFFKQWGSYAPVASLDGTGRLFQDEREVDGFAMRYMGLSGKSGGKVLDGREWCEWPVAPEPVAA